MSSAPAGSNQGKGKAALFSLAVIGLVVSPLAQNWRTEPSDSFPLSYYPPSPTSLTSPMAVIAPGPPQLNVRVAEVTHVFEIDFKGVRNIVPHQLIAPGGFDLARGQLRLAIDGERAEALCHSVAARITPTSAAASGGTRSIMVVRARYDVDAFLEQRVRAIGETVLATCDVEAAKP